MQQTAFNFGPQYSPTTPATQRNKKLCQIKQHAEIYLIHTPDGKLASIRRNALSNPEKTGENYVE